MAALNSAGKPSARWKRTPTAQGYLCNGRMTAFSRLSRFGMTFEPLTGDLGMELLMWYLVGFHVKTSVPPVKAKAFQASEADSGSRCSESRKKSCPDTCSSKIHQCSGREGWKSYCKGLPMQGSMQDGVLSRLPTLALPTLGNEFGLLPTPTADAAIGTRTTKFAQGGTPLSHVSIIWPTPRSTDGSKGGPGRSKKRAGGGNLRTFVATPTARDWKSGKASQATMDRNARPLSEQIGGSLNPTWVEWLMGWPLGWTDLNPLETDKSRQQRL